MNIYQQEEIFKPIHIELHSKEECAAIVRAIEIYRQHAISGDFKARNMNILDPLHLFLTSH